MRATLGERMVIRAAAARPPDGAHAGRGADGDTPSRVRGELVGRSLAMQAIASAVTLHAPSAPIALVTGESGTGKSHLAATLHRLGPACHHTLVRLRCARATDAETIDARLAGGNVSTLVLDEIADLSPDQQSSLVGAIDAAGHEGGAPAAPPVRLIVTSAVNLHTAVASGTFRPDLLYRLNGFALHLPPLRERPEDIEDFAVLFIRDCARRLGRVPSKLTEGAVRVLRTRPWPGNLHELRHVLERAVVVSDGQPVGEGAARRACAEGADLVAAPPESRSEPERLDDAQRVHVRAALVEARGNKSRAAKRLGISRRSLYRWLSRLDL